MDLKTLEDRTAEYPGRTDSNGVEVVDDDDGNHNRMLGPASSQSCT